MVITVCHHHSLRRHFLPPPIGPEIAGGIVAYGGLGGGHVGWKNRVRLFVRRQAERLELDFIVTAGRRMAAREQHGQFQRLGELVGATKKHGGAMQ